MTFRPKLLLRSMPGSLVLMQLGSVMMFMACVSTECPRNHMCANPRAVLSQPHTSRALGRMPLLLDGYCGMRACPYSQGKLPSSVGKDGPILTMGMQPTRAVH